MREEEVWEDEEEEGSRLGDPWKEARRVPAAVVEEERRLQGRKKMEDLAKGSKDGKVRSWQVDQDQIQDFTRPIMVMGCDAEQLYPSLEMGIAAKLVEEAIMKSDIKWKDLEYIEGARMIALNRSEDWIERNGLTKLVPRRRGKTGTRPGVGRKYIFWEHWVPGAGA